MAKTGEVFALSLYNEDTGKYGNRDKNIYILFTSYKKNVRQYGGVL